MPVQVPNLSREGHTLMAVVVVRQRDVVGPKSWTHYRFDPWCLVENRDVPDMQAHTVRLGCACNGDQRELPFFATADQIKSGQVVPEWAAMAWPGQVPAGVSV